MGYLIVGLPWKRKHGDRDLASVDDIREDIKFYKKRVSYCQGKNDFEEANNEEYWKNLLINSEDFLKKIDTKPLGVFAVPGITYLEENSGAFTCIIVKASDDAIKLTPAISRKIDAAIAKFYKIVGEKPNVYFLPD